MDRISGDGYVTVGGKRLWTNGSPGPIFVEGTEGHENWFNGVQEEIVRIIEAAGLTPSDADWDQLKTAIYALFGRLSGGNTWSGTQTFQAVTATDFGAMTGSSVNVGAGTVTAGAVNSSAPSTFQPSSSGTALHAVAVGAGNNALWAETHNTGPAVRAESDSSGAPISASASLGVAIEAQRGSQRGAINIIPTAGDPSAPSDGDLWFNSSTNQLKVRINGATRVINVT